MARMRKRAVLQLGFIGLLQEAMRQDRRHHALLRRLLRMAGQHDTKAADAVSELTERELLVAVHAARSDEKLSVVMDELHMRKRTFDTHLNNAYDKLGGRKRHRLARILAKAGLV